MSYRQDCTLFTLLLFCISILHAYIVTVYFAFDKVLLKNFTLYYYYYYYYYYTTNKNSYALCQMALFPVTLSDPCLPQTTSFSTLCIACHIYVVVDRMIVC